MNLNLWSLASLITRPSTVPNTTPSDALTTLLQIAFDILGALSFFMIVYAGFSYVISQGDAEKAKRAKNTIIYAAVGLVVAGSASVLVQVVLKRFLQ